jgi:hypothetical protein
VERAVLGARVSFCGRTEGMLDERDQVLIGKPNGSSCRKSRPKPLIQSHPSTCECHAEGQGMLEGQYSDDSRPMHAKGTASRRLCVERAVLDARVRFQGWV